MFRKLKKVVQSGFVAKYSIPKPSSVTLVVAEIYRTTLIDPHYTLGGIVRATQCTFEAIEFAYALE